MTAMLASLWLEEALMLAALTLCNSWGRAELARSRSIDCYAQSAMPSLPLRSPRVCKDPSGPGDLPEYPRHALEVVFCAGLPKKEAALLTQGSSRNRDMSCIGCNAHHGQCRA